MSCGGNAACNNYLTSQGVNMRSIIDKYQHPAAALYKERLVCQVEGRPMPSSLPVTNGSGVSHSCSNSTVQGTEPIPGESEAQYIARQRQLQEEARERMRSKFGASKGLSGGRGVMQGIGSDASYNPSQSSAGHAGIGGVDMSAAYSFINSVWETTSKVLLYFVCCV